MPQRRLRQLQSVLFAWTLVFVTTLGTVPALAAQEASPVVPTAPADPATELPVAGAANGVLTINGSPDLVVTLYSTDWLSVQTQSRVVMVFSDSGCTAVLALFGQSSINFSSAATFRQNYGGTSYVAGSTAFGQPIDTACYQINVVDPLPTSTPTETAVPSSTPTPTDTPTVTSTNTPPEIPAETPAPTLTINGSDGLSITVSSTDRIAFDGSSGWVAFFSDSSCSTLQGILRSPSDDDATAFSDEYGATFFVAGSTDAGIPVTSCRQVTVPVSTPTPTVTPTPTETPAATLTINGEDGPIVVVPSTGTITIVSSTNGFIVYSDSACTQVLDLIVGTYNVSASSWVGEWGGSTYLAGAVDPLTAVTSCRNLVVYSVPTPTPTPVVDTQILSINSSYAPTLSVASNGTLDFELVGTEYGEVYTLYIGSVCGEATFTYTYPGSSNFVPISQLAPAFESNTFCVWAVDAASGESSGNRIITITGIDEGAETVTPPSPSPTSGATETATATSTPQVLFPILSINGSYATTLSVARSGTLFFELLGAAFGEESILYIGRTCGHAQLTYPFPGSSNAYAVEDLYLELQSSTFCVWAIQVSTGDTSGYRMITIQTIGEEPATATPPSPSPTEVTSTVAPSAITTADPSAITTAAPRTTETVPVSVLPKTGQGRGEGSGMAGLLLLAAVMLMVAGVSLGLRRRIRD